MVKLTTKQVSKYFIHNVDRWPTTGNYGNTYIYLDTTNFDTLEIKTMQIHSINSGVVLHVENEELKGFHIPINREEKFDVEKKIIKTKINLTFVLTSEPTEELLFNVIINPWDTKYKQMWKGDENYIDYKPAFYKSLGDYSNNKLTL